MSGRVHLYRSARVTHASNWVTDTNRLVERSPSLDGHKTSLKTYELGRKAQFFGFWADGSGCDW